MKPSDRAIMLSVVVAVLMIGFYLMILSPKRQEASTLDEEVTRIQGEIDQQQQVATFAEQAQQDFPRYYGRMVVLGKAVPPEADTSSMLVQLSAISKRAGVKFRGLSLGQGGGGETAGAATPAPTPAPTTPPAEGESAPPAEGGTAAPATPGATPAAATTPAPATETAAASLPIGATVGPAGLPTLPYDLSFNGGFFQVASFIGGLDGLVSAGGEADRVKVDGRLMTIDGFSLKGGLPGSNPELEADFAMTSYVTPAEQGLTLGASPTSPAAGLAAQPTAAPVEGGTVTP